MFINQCISYFSIPIRQNLKKIGLYLKICIGSYLQDTFISLLSTTIRMVGFFSGPLGARWIRL